MPRPACLPGEAAVRLAQGEVGAVHARRHLLTRHRTPGTAAARRDGACGGRGAAYSQPNSRAWRFGSALQSFWKRGKIAKHKIVSTQKNVQKKEILVNLAKHAPKKRMFEALSNQIELAKVEWILGKIRQNSQRDRRGKSKRVIFFALAAREKQKQDCIDAKHMQKKENRFG